MATTLTYSGTTLTLPDNWLRPDEYDWQPVVHSEQYSITGALVVEAAPRLSGRPITLADVWMTRATLDAVNAWATVAGRVMSLVLHDAAPLTVAFRHKEKPVDARQLFEITDPDGSTYYAVTLRFIEVPAA